MPGKDIRKPLPLDIGTGAPVHGIAMLPELSPNFAGLREAYAQYSMPKGVFKQFSAIVGLQRGVENQGAAQFRIMLDGHIAWESAPLTEESPPQKITLDLNDAENLRLSAIDPRQNARKTLFFYPVWANMTLIRGNNHV